MSVDTLNEYGLNRTEVRLLEATFDTAGTGRKKRYNSGFKKLVLDGLRASDLIYIVPGEPGTWGAVLTVKGSDTVTSMRRDRKRRMGPRKPSATTGVNRVIKI